MKADFIYIGVLALFLGCGQGKDDSVGPETEVIVVADSVEYYSLLPDLENVFERYVNTPQKETVMTLRWKRPGEFAQQMRRKNLLLLSSMNKRSPASNLLRDLLGDEVIERVRTGELFLIDKKDEFALNQQLMILTAWNSSDLRKFINENSDLLFGIFDEALYKWMSDRLLVQLQDKDLPKRFKKYGFLIDLPLGYETITDTTGLVWLYSDPTRRWLTIYWEEADEVPLINQEWVVNKRNELGVTVFDSVKVYPEFLDTRRVELNGWTAWRVSGIYEGIGRVLGGPFISYSFYDADTKRVYYIDGAVFAPEKEKLKFLRELELIIRSFRRVNGSE